MGKRRESATTKLAKVATGTALAASGHGGFVAAAKVLETSHNAFRQRRHDKLWAAMVNGASDPAEICSRVEASLLEDGDAIAHGFVSAARAAVEAVEPSAVTSIGLLARRFILTGTPSRREYRAYLDMFESLDAAELGVLRKVVRVLEPYDKFANTEILHSGGTVTWQTVAGLQLGSGQHASHVLEAVREVVAARGDATIPGGPRIPGDVIRMLAELLQITPVAGG